tara:strand:- start:241 stop:681 length:441 start_codon:yes stop_codon:yes gene_type:complete
MEELPLVNFHFQVEWGKDKKIGFSEVTGLNVEHETLEYRQGSSKVYSTIKIPGLEKLSNIVLKRGMLKGDNDLFNWFYEFRVEKNRQNITISLLDEEHKPTVVWVVLNAWPVSIRYSELHATKSEILIERMELAHEGIQVKNGKKS